MLPIHLSGARRLVCLVGPSWACTPTKRATVPLRVLLIWRACLCASVADLAALPLGPVQGSASLIRCSDGPRRHQTHLVLCGGLHVHLGDGRAHVAAGGTPIG